MGKYRFFFLLVIVVGWYGAGCQNNEPEHTLTPVPFNQVHLNDVFWAPKIEINRRVSIPSAFQKAEEAGRMDNFALAGGLIKGEHKGDFPFDDTDVYKILEGASYALAVQYDEKLDGYLDSLIFLIGKAQEADGYLYTCLTNQCERLKPWYGKGRWDRLNSHELYNCGHLYEAAVAHFQATGKRTLLDIAIKNANLVDRVFGPSEHQKKVPSGHPIIEMALVKLFRVTDDEKYLRLARFFIDETGKGTDGHTLSEYSQDHLPIVLQDEAVGHAVRLGYLYSGVTDVASLLGDQSLMQATKKVWDNVVSKKLYVTGGIGSRAQGEGFGPDYDLPNMTAYCETCASISNVYWNYRLFLNDGNSKYYDVLERALYNGVISGVSLSGDRFFYDNPLESVKNHDRAPWFGCACCPGNITRFMASVPGYVYATGKSSIYVNLFASGNASLMMGGGKVGLTQNTLYPWEGKVKIVVDETIPESFDLRIRIPGWARNEVVPSNLYQIVNPTVTKLSISLNGHAISPELVNGYAVIHRTWKKGDVVEVDFPMVVQKIAAIDSVKNNYGKLALQRGPVVYCVEDKDNHDDWMFDRFLSSDASVVTAFEENLLGGVVSLTVPMTKVQMKNDSMTVESVNTRAIPYYAWNNRGVSNMLVWLPAHQDKIIMPPVVSCTSHAVCKGSTDWVSGLNDGFDPLHSGDTDKSYYYWWQKEGAEEWVSYEFDQPVELSASSVYWLVMDHYELSYRLPESYRLETIDKYGKWIPVSIQGSMDIKPNQYNTVRFKPVKTRSIKLTAKLQKGYSGGVLEWKLND